MRNRGVLWSSLILLGTLGACANRTTNVVAPKPALQVAPAKPKSLESIHPARFVLVDSVGATYDEVGEGSPVRTRDFAIVSGKRLVLEGGLIVESIDFPESLSGFHSLPQRLGGGYVFWSDEHSFHGSTFLGKLTPFANVGARGGVRTWFETFVLRTELGPLEVNPSSFAVRRTELAGFSEMLSMDGKLGVRTDAIGRMEVSVDGGKTFRGLVFPERKKLNGPSPGPQNTLLFRQEASNDWIGSRGRRPSMDTHVLTPSGTLIPFDPKANEPVLLEQQNYAVQQEEPAPTRRFAPSDLGPAAALGALVPGEQIILLREGMLRVMSAKTGAFIQDLPLSLGAQDFGHCQPVTIGEEVFLACTHAAGAHLYALRGTPTTAQLAATFPEVGTFVAGLGSRFLFLGRCGSTPPTVRDFLGYSSSDGTSETNETDPNAGQALSDPPDTPEEPPEKRPDEATVCVRSHDGTWVEHHLDGLQDRENTTFLPDDDGHVTVVRFDKPDPENPPKTPEGVRFIYVDPKATNFNAADFFEPEDPSEPKMRIVARDAWLDEKDGSVHGWTARPARDEPVDADELSNSSPNEEANELGTIVGVQIKSDGSVERHKTPKDVDKVVVGGPYALARQKTDEGSAYFESTDGGRSFTPVKAPIPADLIESFGGEIEGCSIIGCALGGGLVRLGWGSDAMAPQHDPDKPEELEALAAKLPDLQKLVPEKPNGTLHCRLEGTEPAKGDEADKPVPVTSVRNVRTSAGTPVDRKWTALATIPFEVKPAHQVQFEDVDGETLEGEGIPLLRSSSTNPTGLFLRTKEFRFDLSSGPKRKPIAMKSNARGLVAVEVDREAFIVLDRRAGDVQLVRGSTARSLMQIEIVSDVNYPSLELARRLGTGSDVYAITLEQHGTGEILLAELDLGQGTVGPLRLAGNMRQLATGAACVHNARDVRMFANEFLQVDMDSVKEHRGTFMGSSLISLGTGAACREASEVRLRDDSTLVIRYSGSDAGGHPAILHGHGKSRRATCTYK